MHGKLNRWWSWRAWMGMEEFYLLVGLPWASVQLASDYPANPCGSRNRNSGAWILSLGSFPCFTMPSQNINLSLSVKEKPETLHTSPQACNRISEKQRVTRQDQCYIFCKPNEFPETIGYIPGCPCTTSWSQHSKHTPLSVGISATIDHILVARIWTLEIKINQCKFLFHYLLNFFEPQFLVYKMGIIVPHRILMKMK